MPYTLFRTEMKVKKLTAALAALMIVVCCFSGCGNGNGGNTSESNVSESKTSEIVTPEAPVYENASFVLSGFWQPHDITEEGFTLYKNAGLNNLLMGYHDGEYTSENRAYLGSVLTQKNLELCRKVGLTATLNFDEWYKIASEGTGYGATPFTTYNLYGEYKDIITAVHMADEPNKKGIDQFASGGLISDFKKVYDVPYFINLLPDYANAATLGFSSYDDYLAYFDEKILSQFENGKGKMVSVDYYPFRATGFQTGWLACLKKIANLSKKNSARTHFYIQTAEKTEFKSGLTEEDIRLQVYVSLCFGATDISYYCYFDPGSPDEPMYEYCILNPDGSPSPLYGYVKNVNSEISSFSSAILAYKWVKCMGYTDYSDGNGSVALGMLRENADFSDRKYVENLKSDGDCLIGIFERPEDEGYMLINYGNPEETEAYDYFVTLKGGATHLAVYGGKGYSGVPEIVGADENGECKLNIEAGEGKFIVPLVGR